MPPTAKRAQVQSDVLRATEELLEGGATYQELNVERIATAAGISRTAFYFYFRDKRELLIRLAGDLTEQLYDQADLWWSGDGDPSESIRIALRNISELYREHSALLRAVVEVSTYDEEIGNFWRGLVGRFVEATERRIEAEIAAGRAPKMPARATAFSVTWMAERTLYQQIVQDRPIGDDELVEALVGIYVRSVYGSTA